MFKGYRRTGQEVLETKFSDLGMVEGNMEQAQGTHSWLPSGSNQHAVMQYLLYSADGCVMTCRNLQHQDD